MLSGMRKSSRTKPYAWLDRFVPLAGVLPFLVYALTVSKTVYPGQSAYLTAVAANIETPTALTRPLFTQLMHAVAQIPLGALPVRLNLTCSILSALTAMLLYRFVARLIYRLAHENPSGSAHIVWEDAEYDQRHGANTEEDDLDDENIQPAESPLARAEREQQHQRAVRSAILGSLAATAFFCFSAPFWIASTRLFSEPLYGLLILLILNLALDLWLQKNTLALFTCTFIAGLIWVENPATALCSLCVALYCVVALAKEPFITWMQISSAWAGLGSGIVLACTALGFTAASIMPADRLSPTAILSAFMRDQVTALHAYIPTYNWIAAATFIAIPTLLALVLFKDGFQRRSWLLLLAEIAWAALLIPTIINMPQGLWRLAQHQTNYPVFVFFILAVQIGILTAIGQHMRGDDAIHGDAARDDDEHQDNTIVGKIGYALSWPFLALVLTTGFWYYADVHAKNTMFADRIAHDNAQQLGKRDWLIGDTLTAYHLPLLMQSQHRPLYSIALDPTCARNQKEVIAHFIQTDPTLRPLQYRLYNALDLSTERFLTTWFQLDKHACTRIAFIKHADLLRANGYDVLAAGVLLIGQKNVTAHAIQENVTAFLAWADTIKPLVQTGAPFAIELLERDRLATCEQISRVANELAYLLATHQREDQAYLLLQRALDFDANNISAAVNYHYLISASASPHAETLTLAENQLKRIAYEAVQRCPVAQQVQDVYGTLINTNHYRRVRSTYWVYAEKDAQDSFAYKTLNTSTSEDTRKQLNHLRNLIRQSLSTCQLELADQQLNVLLEVAPSDTFAWVTRMMVALKKRDFVTAERWMQKAQQYGASPADLLCYEASHLVASNHLAEARTKLEKQLRETPNDLRLWELLCSIVIEQKDFVHLDKRIYPAVRNATNMEEHYLQHLIRAHILLSRSPENATAARILFQRAITLNPLLFDTWIALFRLDDFLGNPVYCETDAKALLLKEPAHPFATYLLGRARLLRGELALANDLFDQARLLDPALPEAYAGLAEVKCAQKQPDAAQQLILKAFTVNGTNACVHSTHQLSPHLVKRLQGFTEKLAQKKENK